MKSMTASAACAAIVLIGGIAMAVPMAVAASDRSDTTRNNEATNSPGMAGPVEGGKHAAPTKHKPSITQGAGNSGGVQNPHLGTGNNGSSRSE